MTGRSARKPLAPVSASASRNWSGGAVTVGWDSPGSRGSPGANRIVANDDYNHGPNDLPFKPLFCGTCEWRTGHFWERDASTLFGIELVLEGDVEFVQNGRHYLVQTGELFLLQPGARHRYTTGPSGLSRRAFAGFSGTLMESFLTRTGLGEYDVIAGADAVGIPGMLTNLESILRASPQRDQRALSELSYSILLRLAGLVQTEYPASVRDALAFVRQNLAREVSTAEIAHAARVSVPHLSRLFRTHLHTSPVHYHIRERMARARLLLRHSSYAIKEVARMSGYEDPLYFSKRFRKHAGVSPRQWRRGEGPGGWP